MIALGSGSLIELDIKHVEGKVKSMNIVSQAEASVSTTTTTNLILVVLLALSAKNHGGTESHRLFRMSNEKFKEAARAGTYSAYTYYRWDPRVKKNSKDS